MHMRVARLPGTPKPRDALLSVHDLLCKVAGHGHLAHLPGWARVPFQRGGDVFHGQHWQRDLKRIIAEAQRQERLDTAEKQMQDREVEIEAAF